MRTEQPPAAWSRSICDSLWYATQESLLRRLALAPLDGAAALFAAAAGGRRWLYRAGLLRTEHASAPVISVGNIVAGGAGKTPVVLHLAEMLGARGLRVAVLSRGYRRRGGQAIVVSDGTGRVVPFDESGDEPQLLARRLPQAMVLVGPRRAELARQACGRGAQALLLDDGFQHLSLARDLDVVVVDAAAPFGNGWLLPRGPLRETPRSLSRAHLVWLSKVDLSRDLSPLRELAKRATGHAPVEAAYRVTDVLDAALARSYGVGGLAGARVLLLAGIARPASFRALVERAGATVAAEAIFPDHHRYSEHEIESVLERSRTAGCDSIVCTEKDAVRLPAAGADFRAIRIASEILAGAETLSGLIDGLFTREEAA